MQNQQKFESKYWLFWQGRGGRKLQFFFNFFKAFENEENHHFLTYKKNHSFDAKSAKVLN